MKKAFIAAALCLCVMSSSVFADNYDYGMVQSASIQFYDANMCGDEVSDKSLVDWRGNCHSADLTVPLDTEHTDLTQDFIEQNRAVLDSDGDGSVNVSGGYHDAGDFVKFGLPQMYTAVTLQWALYEFNDSFKSNNDTEHLNVVLGQFNEYIKNCTFMDENGQVVAFCYQVGDGKTDHDYWGAPEVQPTERPAYFATAARPATDITSLAAAAMAADYINSGNNESLKYAKALYSFANDNPVKVVGDDHAPSDDEYYKSCSYKDDLAYAAAWLYIATGDNTYLNEAEQNLNGAVYDVPYWIYCWDDTWLGGMVLIAEKTGNSDYWNAIKETLDIWQTNYNSPQGYACIDKWGSARYNTNAQFIALIYAKHKGNMRYADWAKSQMDYLLGDNTSKTCYITGISENSVKYPHHAAASGLSDANDKSSHKYVLYGALVGGPDKNDKHKDVTADYQYNEVSLDYNAGLVGACAGIYAFYGERQQEIDTETTESTTITYTESTTMTNTEYTTETETDSEAVTSAITGAAGDVNLDGSWTAADAAMVLQKALDSSFKMSCEEKYPDKFMYIADTTGDGALTANDAASILQKALDGSYIFPITPMLENGTYK